MATQKIEPKQLDFSDLPDGDVTNAGGTLGTIKHNRAAGASPTGSDNFASGWALGSTWIYGSTEYLCVGDGSWVQTYPADATNAIGTLPVSKGGTGATDAAGARTNLGAAAALHGHSTDEISDDSTWEGADLTDTLDAIQTQLDGKVTSPASPVDGDILYRSSGAWSRLPKGTDGQFLTLTSGVPAWANAAGGSGVEYVTTISWSGSGATVTAGTTAPLTAGDYLLQFAASGSTCTTAYRINSGSDVTVTAGNGNNNANIQVTVTASQTISLRPTPGYSGSSYFSMIVWRIV